MLGQRIANPFVACLSQARGIAFSSDFIVFSISTISQNLAGFGTFCDVFLTRRVRLSSDYARALPVLNPEAMDRTSLNYSFGNMEGETTSMSKTAKNAFSARASIKAETIIRIWLKDPRMWDDSSLAIRRNTEVDGEELVITGTFVN